MFDWKAARTKARTIVQETMGVAAYLVVRQGADPVPLKVRGPHKAKNVVNNASAEDGAAKFESQIPTILLWRSEIPSSIRVTRGVIIVLGDNTAYRVSKVHVTDELTLPVEVERLSPSECVGLPVPGSYTV